MSEKVGFFCKCLMVPMCGMWRCYMGFIRQSEWTPPLTTRHEKLMDCMNALFEIANCVRLTKLSCGRGMVTCMAFVNLLSQC